MANVSGLASGELENEVLTINSNSSLSTSIQNGCFISLFVEIPGEEAEIDPVGVEDPTNVSKNESKLINNITTDLVYNKKSIGTTNKEMPAIDLGSSQALGKIVIYWWQATYVATNFKIQGSDDLSNWTDVATGLDGTGQNIQEIILSGTFRYWRLFCVQGLNPHWICLSEIRAYAPPTQTEFLPINQVSYISMSHQGSSITLHNSADVDVTVEVTTGC